MSRRVAVSLLLVALLSGAVVAEAETNYASVTGRDDTTAAVADARVEDGALAVDIRVDSSMNGALRVEYVHLSVARPGHTDGASTPFNGLRSLSPGENDLGVSIPARQISGTISTGDTVTITGEIVVSVYNDYEFAIPIEETEVRL